MTQLFRFFSLSLSIVSVPFASNINSAYLRENGFNLFIHTRMKFNQYSTLFFSIRKRYSTKCLYCAIAFVPVADLHRKLGQNKSPSIQKNIEKKNRFVIQRFILKKQRSSPEISQMHSCWGSQFTLNFRFLTVSPISFVIYQFFSHIYINCKLYAEYWNCNHLFDCQCVCLVPINLYSIF